MRFSFDIPFEFLQQFVREPGTTGAIVPSSTALARAMVEWLEFDNSRAIVECGPGTGSFTQAVLPELRSRSKFFLVEINPRFVQILRARFPDYAVYEESVLNVKKLCEREGASKVDCIISGLPWASFSENFQEQSLAGILEVLKPGPIETHLVMSRAAEAALATESERKVADVQAHLPLPE